MRELIHEIASSLRNNKLRTALTGFAVSWGIFLLIALLGAGNGLMNSFMGNKERFIPVGVTVEGWLTSQPYDGFDENRIIQLDQKDLEYTKDGRWDDIIGNVAVQTSSFGVTMELDGNTLSTSLMGVMPQYKEHNKKVTVAGRFINEQDIKERRKVIVLYVSHVRQLNPSYTPESMVGRWVSCNGMNYRVVGVFYSQEDRWTPSCLIPYTTHKAIYDPSNKIETITFTLDGVKTKEEHEAFEERYLSGLKSRHHVAPDDPRAFWVNNGYLRNMSMSQATHILNIAMWILGILTLISGIVGVSNIMLITVKERTHEFGIRKAIGAKPMSILSLIIAESITITSIFGYTGMLLGMVACEIMDKTVGQHSINSGFDQIQLLVNPQVGLDTALEATLLLVIAGTLAGAAPAWKASRVKPIEALRSE